jgi:large subunit ribosomal protein L10
MVEARVVNIADLNAIASLPSKEELIAKLLFLLNAPAQRLAVATNGVAPNLACSSSRRSSRNNFKNKRTGI